MPGMMSRIFEGDEGASRETSHDHSVAAHADPELHVEHDSAADVEMGDHTMHAEQGVELDYEGHAALSQTAHDGMSADAF